MKPKTRAMFASPVMLFLHAVVTPVVFGLAKPVQVP